MSIKQSPLTDISVLVQETPFTDSRRKEINRLLKKGISVVIMEKDIPQGIYIFNSRFINKIKYPSTNKAFKKLRLVIQAYNN
jgi:predicted Fe-Mo cluster-binding NifX family protein